MGTFFEFLLDKGYLSKEHFLSALILQQKNLPSIHEIVQKSGLLSVKDHLRVIFFQKKENVSFQKACEKNNLFTKELLNLINSSYEKEKSLEEILIEEKYITTENLTSFLDEYISIKSTDKKEDLKEKNEENINKDSAKEISFKNFEKVMLDEFASVFSKKSKEDVCQILNHVKNKKEINTTNFKIEIKSYFASAKFLKAEICSKYLNEIIKILDNNSQINESNEDLISADDVEKICLILDQVFILSESILKNGSEKAYYENNQKEINTILNGVI